MNPPIPLGYCTIIPTDSPGTCCSGCQEHLDPGVLARLTQAEERLLWQRERVKREQWHGEIAGIDRILDLLRAEQTAAETAR
ncbi:hypothetical protein [Actinomadura harenae]|uniref:Uncharacterized protein n=1 Tax=Actinomadura harenae TaxID=2483351 RepID=A0A3M2LR65_9ACTN|nr:hypothetical protein [Actinomadura harenae]RMI39974.1 hypothetical protein EBO15_28175 [Actinomadura harenae]